MGHRQELPGRQGAWRRGLRRNQQPDRFPDRPDHRHRVELDAGAHHPRRRARPRKPAPFVDRFGSIRAAAAFAPALAVALARPWLTAIYNALVLSVIAYPAARWSSPPHSLVIALASAARHGILIKGGVHPDAGTQISRPLHSTRPASSRKASPGGRVDGDRFVVQCGSGRACRRGAGISFRPPGSRAIAAGLKANSVEIR